MANFNLLQAIQAPRIIGELPSSGGGGGDEGGIGELFEGLQGLIGAFKGGSGGGGGGGGSGPSGGGGGNLTRYMNTNTQQPSRPIAMVAGNSNSVQSGLVNAVHGLGHWAKGNVNLTLNPKFSSVLPNFIQDLKQQGFQPMIASGFRTQKEQAQKVAQGYSQTMNSRHTQGNAVDIIDARYGWNTQKYGKEIGTFANAMKTTAAKYGLKSGTEWKSFGPFGDFAHVEMPHGQQGHQHSPGDEAGTTTLPMNNPPLQNRPTNQQPMNQAGQIPQGMNQNPAQQPIMGFQPIAGPAARQNSANLINRPAPGEFPFLQRGNQQFTNVRPDAGIDTLPLYLKGPKQPGESLDQAFERERSAGITNAPYQVTRQPGESFDQAIQRQQKDSFVPAANIAEAKQGPFTPRNKTLPSNQPTWATNRYKNPVVQNVIDNPNIPEAAKVIASYENFSNKTYWDVNAHRLGFGTDTITRADGSVQKVRQGMTVNQEDATRDLIRRTNEFRNTAISQVGNEAWQKLHPSAQSALTSVAYNYGSLPKNIVGAVKSGDINQIAAAVRSRATDNKGINKRRRLEEANMISSVQQSTMSQSSIIKPPQSISQQPQQRINSNQGPNQLLNSMQRMPGTQSIAGPAANSNPSIAGGNNMASTKELTIPNVYKSAQTVYQDNPVMADLATAQAILESRLNGSPSGLAKNYNNLFGIKGSGTAGSASMRTHEYGSQGKYYTNSGFAKNATLSDSFLQHKNLMNKGIKSNPALYHKVLKAKSFEEAASALKAAGYATDPAYVKKLMQIYKNYIVPLKGVGMR